MKIFATILLIIFNSGIIHSSNEFDFTTESSQVKNITYSIIKDNEEKCYGYCFNIVQPVLEHTVHIQVKDKQIQEQAITLKEYEKQIADLKMKVAIFEEAIKNKDQQILLCDKSKNESLEKSTIIAAKDELLSNLNEKIMEYKIKLGNCLATSCINKLTDIYEIKVPGIDAFSVPCDSRLAGAGWTVIQRRMDGSVDFNRNWTDYREGFGDLRGEFFIGLDKLHLITKSQTHELYIYLKDFNDKERYARYDHFYIGNEDEFYKIKSIGSYSGDAGDDLKNHKDSKFSTSDRDNDDDLDIVDKASNPVGGFTIVIGVI
ncbi:angiopoietin-related protein 7-like isoform X3 [Drosophila albomicans]|uniref:Angiopoietin-related protein 7-like isoform X3 n=1 Tax=Drosophila albomicans TaxID=7291 RepID=A0A6P8WI05_DROAB|nr:angiopoietin-related protein 7-like isoform X3 [Drosophila albomicans]